MRQVAIASLLCLLLGATAFAGPFYFDLEQFIVPPGGLGVLDATFGFEFIEAVGDSGWIVSSDLCYHDANLWVWRAPAKSSDIGLSLSLKTPWSEGALPDRWVFDVDATIDLKSKVPHYLLRPESSEVSFTLSAVLSNWALFIRATSVIDYNPYAWNLLPSFGLSSH